MRTRRISMQRQIKTSLPSPVSTALLILLTIPSLTSAAALHGSVWTRPRDTILSSPEALFARDSTCGESSYLQCSNAGLPSNFCCPSGDKCIALAGNTSAICCPSGSDCAEIESIPCDVSLEDKDAYPKAAVMTTALTGTLEKCGDKCCPFGYSCNADGNCVMNQDQSAKPSTSSVSSSTTATATSSIAGTSSAAVKPTSDSSPSPTDTSSSGSSSSSDSGSGSSTATTEPDSTSGSSSSSSSSSSSDSDSDSSSSSTSKAGIVAGGVVGGIAGALLIGFLIFFCVKREMKRKQDDEKQQSSTAPGSSASERSSSFGNILGSPVTRGASQRGPISKPILIEDPIRSDFGRKISPHTNSFAHGSDAGSNYGRTMGSGDVSEYYGAGAGNAEKEAHHNNEYAGDDDYSMNDERYDNVSNLHEVPRSPPRISKTRAVSSMYVDYYDPTRISEYQPPVKMPSARAYGGSGDGNPFASGSDADDSEYGGYGAGAAGQRDAEGAYIDVFADSNSLAPPPLRRGNSGKGSAERVTRFSDVMDEARRV